MTKTEEKRTAWAVVLGTVAYIAILCLLAGLGGCATAPQSTVDKSKFCDVLGPVIKVNTKNKDSTWHAGSSLAKRVYRNDDVGANLRCKGY